MSTKIDENTTLEPRDMRGRFQPGAPGGPGRKPNGVAAALRRLVEPDKIAEFVYGILNDDRGRFTTGDRMWACKFIADRIDGKPVQAVAMSVAATVEAGLPEGWDEMSASQRVRYLDGVRQRALEAGGK